jgi:hypothetical protein
MIGLSNTASTNQPELDDKSKELAMDVCSLKQT